MQHQENNTIKRRVNASSESQLADQHQFDRREFLALAALLLAGTKAGAAELPKLIFSCAPDNDLYQALETYSLRFDNAAEAIHVAPHGASCLLLADHYPHTATSVGTALFEVAAQKKLRIYLEFPLCLPDSSVGIITKANYERGVVKSKRFAPALAPMRILTINDCYYVALNTSQSPEIVLARVAGCDTAVYGLPQNGVRPLLFNYSPDLMVATTQLSNFRTARYGPSAAWTAVWKEIVDWLFRKSDVVSIGNRPSVSPTSKPLSSLIPATEEEAFRRGIAWYSNAKMLIDTSWASSFQAAAASKDNLAPGPKREWPSGNGSEGMLEGFSSSIELDGSQPVRWALRADCMGEASFAFALASELEKNNRNRDVASNLHSYVFDSPELAGLTRANPKSPSFGLLNWNTQAKGFYYADDNVRCLLGTIGASAILGTDAWDKRVLSCIFANYRTTGPSGFRGKRILESGLQKHGWRYYFELDRTHYAPHFEGYAWAIYLWAYDKTKYQPFLDLAKTGIRKTMAAYPDQWQWTNGIQQERARMLLPLAWLVRIEDTPEHRGWLELMAHELLHSQDSSGAIREEIGNLSKGAYGPPTSNEQYGTAEAPLIQENGDKVCDLLYTCSFAFLGLHEAAAATKNVLYIDAADKLANLFCRIQIAAVDHPELDGAWFRAFDYGLWDYWASNSDSGWGAWSVETGWTQAWILNVLGMRRMKSSLWDLTHDSKIGRWMNVLKPQFLDDRS